MSFQLETTGLSAEATPEGTFEDGEERTGPDVLREPGGRAHEGSDQEIQHPRSPVPHRQNQHQQLKIAQERSR